MRLQREGSTTPLSSGLGKVAGQNCVGTGRQLLSGPYLVRLVSYTTSRTLPSEHNEDQR